MISEVLTLGIGEVALSDDDSDSSSSQGSFDEKSVSLNFNNSKIKKQIHINVVGPSDKDENTLNESSQFERDLGSEFGGEHLSRSIEHRKDET